MHAEGATGMIALGKRLTQLRRERGVTQEALAQHVGVTKAAVSKWENGQSLPDIALLPLLAAYFDVSIDSLLDYRAHMSREELRHTHTQMTALFAQGKGEEALKSIRELMRRYHADAAVLIECALLMINHTSSQDDLQCAMDALTRAREIGTLPEIRQASCLIATCMLAQGRAQEAIDELKQIEEFPLSISLQLAQAYQIAQMPDQAIEQAQWTAYMSLMNLISALGCWSALPGAPAKQLLKQLRMLEEAFSIRQLHPVGMLTVYMHCAMGLAAADEKEAALTALEQYVRLAQRETIEPVVLRAIAPFDRIDERLNELPLGVLPPVDEKLARERIEKSMTENPAFQNLVDDARFEALTQRLKAQLA